jgi:hypothetical protein
MPQIRKNPLPAGRYWIFVQAPSIEILDQWLKYPGVTVLKREESGGLRPFVSPNEVFVLFEISLPLPWPRGIGFPNAAALNETQASDVVQRPPPMTVKQAAKDIIETASEAATEAITGTVILAAIVLWAVSQRR